MPIYSKIILVDDDRDDIELFQSVIQGTCPDVQLTIATNGEKLIYLLKEIPTPDIILLDLNMPIKDGKQCLAEIRSKTEYNDIAIAIYSTSGRKADIDYCLSNGANHYFVKPQTYSGLIAFVQDLCMENRSALEC